MITRITIDPGSNGSGYALWDEKWNLQSYGIIIPKSTEWRDKLEEVTNQLFLITAMNPYMRNLYIEYPKVFGGAIGNAIAMRGDIVKLATLVGFICGRLSPNLKFELIEVTSWLGQLSKSAVLKRVKKIYPQVIANSHDLYAIGIGLYKKGEF